MRALLSILGIACAVVAALVALLITGPVMAFVALALLVAAGIVAILARGPLGLPVGVALIVLGVLSLLYLNPIIGESATYLADLPPFFSDPWLVVMLLLGTAGILLVNRAAWGADWVGYGGFGAVAIALILTFMLDPNQFGTMGGALNWGIAVLAVLAAVACALLLREPVPDAAPTTTGRTTIRNR